MNPPQIPPNFTPLTFEESQARARAVSVAGIREWFEAEQKGRGLLFDEFREDGSAEIAIVRDAEAVPQPLWIVGDIHADVLALANIIEFAERSAPELGTPAFLFLGDFVDRGRHDHDTLLLLFGLIMRNPGRVCVIPGNHDVDLAWGQKSQRFGVTIHPAEYCERLNALLGSEQPDDREQIELAKLSIEFWKSRPKAVFLPDGTMFTHGGFPHTDLHDSLKKHADLCAKKCIDDFLWARLSESQKKRPNRGNRGHEFGWRDFAQFCRVMTEQVQVLVRRLIRGHDHVPERWRMPLEYTEYPVLTINAMGWRMDGEPDVGGPHPYPVVARHVPDQLPILMLVPLSPAEVDRGFGREPASSDAPQVVPPEKPPSETTLDMLGADFGGPSIEAQEPPPPTRPMGPMPERELGEG